MPLGAGDRLGPYEIVAPIGAGGMGEVYKATDTRLDRTVAIKVLPEHLSENTELKQRFEVEARAVSSLNHPNICTLHDVHLRQGSGGRLGDEVDVDFMVMEYLEGETLAERLTTGPVPFHIALTVGAEIADALDKAHRSGIVHRDLKPANIMLTRAGAKLLDFGLAKQADAGGPEGLSSLSSLPTEAKGLTQKGAILGTFQYMAPEQLEGQPATPQTDIFALGVVLYEMVTGRKAFEGKSPASLISSIMTSEPAAASTLEAMTPRALDTLIKDCLRKDPEDRWASAGDVARQLKRFGDEDPDVPVAMPRAAGGRGLERLLAVAGGIIIGALGLWALGANDAPTPLLTTRFSIQVSPEQALRGNIALSPDGRTLAYIARNGEEMPIYVRSLDDWGATPLALTAGAFSLSMSPDSEWVAFAVPGLLKKIAIAGGEPVTLCKCEPNSGSHWGENGLIAFSDVGGVRLWSVPENGGEPSQLTDPAEGNAQDPHWLPGGRALLFAGEHGIEVLELESKARRVLLDGHSPHYAASGHLVFGREGTLWAAPFDSEQRELLGDPVPVVENVQRSQFGSGTARVEIARDGTLVFVPAGAALMSSTLVWVDTDGDAVPAFEGADSYETPRLSPDGRRVGVSISRATGEQDIWVINLDTGTRTRLTVEGVNRLPAWSPDGAQITFASERDQAQGLYRKNADGTGAAELLLEHSNFPVPDWSSDGRILAFAETAPGSDLVLQGESGDTSVVEKTPFHEGAPRFAPGGHYLAYVSNESGQFEVYVRGTGAASGKWPISSGGGREPVWSRDGRKLFYRRTIEMWQVDVTFEPSFAASKPTLLFSEAHGAYGISKGPLGSRVPNYDVAADGRFLMPSQAGTDLLSEIRVVLHWTEELKRLSQP